MCIYPIVAARGVSVAAKGVSVAANAPGVHIYVYPLTVEMSILVDTAPSCGGDLQCPLVHHTPGLLGFKDKQFRRFGV